MSATDEQHPTRATPALAWSERPAARIAAFTVALAVLFGAGAGLGTLVGPDTAAAAAAPTSHTDAGADGAGHSGGHGGGGDARPGSGPTGAAGDAVEGLDVSREGYTLETLAAPSAAGMPAELAFRVLGPSGAPVTAYTPTHDKPLHLIVVRRDQSGFQHLHPVLGPDGTWRTPLTLDAGDHRLLADFAPDGRADALTLGRDLPVGGDYRPVALPAASTSATTPDGYTVTLTGALAAGTSSPLTLTVTKNGALVGDLQPYLAAYGHLVALRTGDLAYLHVHPEGAPGDGRTPSGPDIRFSAEVPTPGPYRLYLDFAHGDVVRTVEFTTVASGATTAPSATSAPADTPAAASPVVPADPDTGAAATHGGAPGHGH